MGATSFSVTVDYDVRSANWWADRWTKGKVFQKQQRKRQDKLLGYCLGRQCKLKPPVLITFTRHSAGKLDDDNLEGGLKHIRDGFCAGMLNMPLERAGLADGVAGLSFAYKQKACGRRIHKITIDVTRC